MAKTTKARTQKTRAKPKPKAKSCFVVCPIGEDGSETRLRSDDIFENLIEPIAKKHGYDAFRITEVSTPGEITPQIVEAVMESDLVIADLSGRNPNVFYELALRHMIGEPFIHLITDTSEIPFDIAGLNAIKLRFGFVGDVHQTEQELSDQIAAIKAGKANFQNPVSRYKERTVLEASGDPEQIEIANLRDEMRSLRKQISNVRNTAEVAREVSEKSNWKSEAHRLTEIEKYFHDAPRMGALSDLGKHYQDILSNRISLKHKNEWIEKEDSNDN